MNDLHDLLYNVCCMIKAAKELWESLDYKYRTEDVDTKKFVIEWFVKYKIVDSKIVIDQVQEIQVILHEIYGESMVLSGYNYWEATTRMEGF